MKKKIRLTKTNIIMDFVVALVLLVGVVFGLKTLAENTAGKITVSKTAVTSENKRGADVTLEINTTELDPPTVDVVLIMDRSGSMKYCVDPKGKTNNDGYCKNESNNRMTAAQNAANAMVNTLLKGENKENVRISYVTFSTAVESNNTFYTDTQLNNLKNAINGTEADGGTNLQSALNKANALLADSTATNKIVVVVTDGEPSFFTVNGKTYGSGSEDSRKDCEASTVTGNSYNWGRCYIDGKHAYTKNFYGEFYYEPYYNTLKKPSEAAKEAADTLKTNGANIYAIGFSTDAEHLGDFLTNDIGSGSGFAYTATDTDKLNTAMDNIANEINNLLAINAKVNDVVPKEFTLKNDSFELSIIDEEGRETKVDTNSVKFTACTEELKAEGKCNEVGTTIIDLDMGNIISTVKTYKITYHVDAKPEYSGAIYTNEEATLTATATSANKYYEDKNINIPFDKPVVAIGAVTNDDDYTKEPLIDGDVKEYDVLANDSEILKDTTIKYNEDGSTTEGTTTVNSLVVIDSVSCGEATVVDNKISYDSSTCSKTNDGNVTIKYHVNLDITINGKNTKIDSIDAKNNQGPSTVSIKVNKVPTSYIVKYIDEETNKPVADEKTVTENVYVNDTVTENAVAVANYVVDKETKELTLDKTGNEIVFKYNLKEVNYVVKYLNQLDNKPVADEETGTGKITKTVEEKAKTIKGYDLVGDAVKTITLQDGTNIIEFYYLPRVNITTTYKYEDKEETTSTTKDYAYNTDYTTKGDEKLPAGYVLKEQPANASGKATKDTEVVYEYVLERFNVTTIHTFKKLDGTTDTKQAAKTEYKYGATYTTEGANPVPEGYELKATPENATGTVKKDETVTYEYILKTVTITTVCKYEEGENTTEEKEYKYGEDYTTSCESNDNYIVTTPEDATGTATEDKEVVYEHKLKEGTVTTKFETTDGKKLKDPVTKTYKYTKPYTAEPKETFENYVFVKTEGLASGTMSGNVTVTHLYELAPAKVITNHYLKDTTTKVGETVEKPYHYTEEYTTTPLNDYRYTLVATPKNATGTVDKDEIVVNYYYTKNTGKVIVSSMLVGTTTKIASDIENTYDYGKEYTVSPNSAVDAKYVLVKSPEETTGTVNSPEKVYTYYYDFKPAVVNVYYKELNTEEELSKPVEIKTKYDQEYKTTEAEDIPENYELAKIEGTANGIVDKDVINVTYYYTKKNSQVDAEIDKVGQKITSTKDKVKYSISYEGKVTDYIGKGKLTVVDTLPFAINEEESELAGGKYNSEDKTITWTQEIDIDSYKEDTITFEKEITVQFVGLTVDVKQVTNNVQATLKLDETLDEENNEDVVTNQVTNEVEIPGTIIVHYVDQDGNPVAEDEEFTSIAGETLVTEPKEIEGYELSESPEAEDFIYTEGTHEITYTYSKGQVAGESAEFEEEKPTDSGKVLGESETNKEEMPPKTGDSIIAIAILMILSLFGMIFTSRRIVARQK